MILGGSIKKIKKPFVAISGCLLGEEIRYDGQHKWNSYVNQELAEAFEYLSVCPEVAMGLGVPRPSIKLIQKEKELLLVDANNISIDHTKKALKTFKTLIIPLDKASGFIFTKNSPSCGFDPVKVYGPGEEKSVGKSMGLWADYVSTEFPLVPKIDSGRLSDDDLRNKFRTQVLIFDDFRKLVKKSKDLIQFHENHKLYILLYGNLHLSKLTEICSNLTKENFSKVLFSYSEYLFGTVFLKNISSNNKAKVIETMVNYFKNELGPGDEKYLKGNIRAYYMKKLKFENLLNLIYFLAKTGCKKDLEEQRIFSLY